MIELHPEKKMPLYEQLYNALAQDIRSGALQPGKALPGRRTMAAQLGISTNTVDTAYQMLAAEGLAVTRPRSGFFVQETGGMLHTRPQHSVVPAPKATPKNTVSNQDDILYDLSTGSIDTSLFPARSWGRIQKELMYQRPELLQRGDMQGDENLRAQIAAYLGEYRGVDCTADQVVVGAGVEYLLGCLAHLFAGSTAAAVAVIIGVFAVKSVLFIIPASMIYISVGMAFPTVSAIAINLAGIALEITVTYLLGWFLGGEYVEKRLKGSKAGDKVLALGDGKKLSALFLVRFLPVFPIDFVSLFLGATKLPYWKYALISLGGIMPRVILFTILGDGIYDYIPMDKIVLVIVCCIPAVIIWWVIKFFRNKKKNSSAG